MWWTGHIVQNTLSLSYNQLPLVLLEIWLDTYTLREVPLPPLGKGSLGGPARPPQMLLCEQGADRSSGPASLSLPRRGISELCSQSCSSSSLRMKIPTESAFSPELEKESLWWIGRAVSISVNVVAFLQVTRKELTEWGNLRTCQRKRKMPHSQLSHQVCVKGLPLAKALTYPTFLELTTICLEKWCLFEDKEENG